jgi:hypothetical protein
MTEKFNEKLNNDKNPIVFIKICLVGLKKSIYDEINDKFIKYVTGVLR